MAVKKGEWAQLRQSSKSKNKKVNWDDNSEKRKKNKIFDADDIVDPNNTNTNHVLNRMRQQSLNIKQSIQKTTQIINQSLLFFTFSNIIFPFFLTKSMLNLIQLYLQSSQQIINS